MGNAIEQQLVLVTGGAGYIGSHTVVELTRAGYKCIVIDDFSNSKASIIDSLHIITGVKVEVYTGDVGNKEFLRGIFSLYNFEAVIHFAGLKSVSESSKRVLDYIDVNVIASVNLLSVMAEFSVHRFIFSSSATVYDPQGSLPFTENSRLRPTNTYGDTKLMVENICQRLALQENSAWNIITLRYFNPIGAHKSGLIGEDPKGIPNNLVPYLMKVANGRLKELPVFGSDYPTTDGTGERDYIHVLDLASGHVAALSNIIDGGKQVGYECINLGCGRATSVLELIAKFESVTGVRVPYRLEGRRSGDVAKSYADCDKAKKILGWASSYEIGEMLLDSWNYAK